MSDSEKASTSRPSQHDGYESPLGGRYASKEMQAIWSARHKFELWRKIWLAVAKAQQACGVNITDAQIAELEAHLEVTDGDIARAAEHEKRLRHDVMSHVHALGDVCPTARPIIHLGMTSEDINGNTELVLIHLSMQLILEKHGAVNRALVRFADRWKSLPTLGLTHFQPAQPTTVGRRAAMWWNELAMCWRMLDLFERQDHTPVVRGFRGATGTQAGYLALLDNDPDRVARFEARAIWNLMVSLGFEEGSLDDRIEATRDGLVQLVDRTLAGNLEDPNIDDDDAAQVAEMMREQYGSFGIDGYTSGQTLGLTGQTYPRVHDAMVMSSLGCVASALHKIATDIRLLSNRREVEEPFEAEQIGSSAMPYKRNPMRCERICGLARFVMNLVPNAMDTAATQWLERTLDDSANRRLTLPEAFLALDGCLDLMRNVISGLVVNEAMVRKNLMAEMPFLATEHLMMQAVGLGRDRQDVHEAIRTHAMAAVNRMKTEGAENDLLDRLKQEPLLRGVDFTRAMDPMAHIGLAIEQTEQFVRECTDPLEQGSQEHDGNAGGPSV